MFTRSTSQELSASIKYMGLRKEGQSSMASLVLTGRADISTIHWDGTKRADSVVEEVNESCLGHTTRQLTRDVHSAIGYIDLEYCRERPGNT